MELETKRLKITKRYWIFNIIGFPLFTILFLLTLLLFAYNLIDLWIFYIELFIAIPCWMLSFYFKFKLKKLHLL